MTTINTQINEKLEDGTTRVLHPETDASIVIETNEKQFVSSTQKEGLDELIQMKEDDAFGNVNDVQDYNGNSLVTNKIAKLLNYAILDSNGKIKVSDLPDAILGQMLYGGNINQSGVANLTSTFKSKYGITTSTITLTSSSYSLYEGTYFIAQDTSTFTNKTIIGVENVSTGDWIVSLGTQWAKIDNTDAVSSVNGKTGAVTIEKDDIIGLENVENTLDSTKNVASAGKFTSSKTLTIGGDASGSVTTDFSTNPTLNIELKASGVTAGTYSAVAVNTKGIVTNGGQVLEVGGDSQTSPSSTLVVGGLFFKRI